MRNIVVIPVYKTQPDADERLSLKQCVDVLGGHDMCLVCPLGLDTSAYSAMMPAHVRIQRFDVRFFQGIEGYNELLKSHAFYASFRAYEYMLIYQLDAWVFQDRLDYWCREGYDYIGAPWFRDWMSHEDGCEMMYVGNGGFSLRKVKTFLRLTHPKTRVKGFDEVLALHKGGFRELMACFRDYFSEANSLKTFMEAHRKSWEDVFFCHVLRATRLQLRTPSCRRAALFAIETSPKYLFEEVNEGLLPFGCHAWRRYQYDTFWKHIIQV